MLRSADQRLAELDYMEQRQNQFDISNTLTTGRTSPVACTCRETSQTHLVMSCDTARFGNIYESVQSEEDIFIIHVFKVTLERHVWPRGKNWPFSSRALVTADDASTEEIYTPVTFNS